MPSAPEELRSLHRDCVLALRDYIEQANKTCQLLDTLKAFPVSLKKRTEIIQQRRAENKAYEI